MATERLRTGSTTSTHFAAEVDVHHERSFPPISVDLLLKKSSSIQINYRIGWIPMLGENLTVSAKLCPIRNLQIANPSTTPDLTWPKSAACKYTIPASLSSSSIKGVYFRVFIRSHERLDAPPCLKIARRWIRCRLARDAVQTSEERGVR